MGTSPRYAPMHGDVSAASPGHRRPAGREAGHALLSTQPLRAAETTVRERPRLPTGSDHRPRLTTELRSDHVHAAADTAPLPHQECRWWDGSHFTVSKFPLGHS